ncbi:GNAT family N-acetyltransferase [Achromobacter denitrificans]|uniref:GNAT family N-acetyltransferase n=1 Tax=Achromobacter denitrificans TaxID=32002 RepID=A0ABZ3FYZ4_ACHDE|nr:GNAT family N-acetyltransferase [Achromobacter denitrificans]MDX3877818.1 GNAT family N-acetyltransferase [Achromobacter sp.]MBV2162156.1 GNAT family N-acetyltransferase [Achromobacter denitrificans]MDF3850089.1 GNAT family N-acetyltransferase [Achromobacter denitrificans]MPT37837.1 GNAT family N-acetyltransferase [Achromobacter sp.]OLU10068.1 N-acetyltransferase [Achromobacter denitrificans]
MPIHIRPATVDDISAIERIVRDAYSPYIQRIGATPGPMLDDYPARIAQGLVHVLLASGDVQALLVLIPEPDCLLLDNIAVSPGAQGKGYGRHLLRFAEDEARRRGLAAIRLYTQEKMTENIGIYRRHGYVETHRAEEIGLKRVFMKKAL